MSLNTLTLPDYSKALAAMLAIPSVAFQKGSTELLHKLHACEAEVAGAVVRRARLLCEVICALRVLFQLLLPQPHLPTTSHPI